MKIAHSLKMFAGSVAIYVTVASAYACGDADQSAKSSGASATSSGGKGGASGASATGGEDSTSGSVGSGPVPPAMADPVPGTRLQSRYRVADDGSREWIGWYDSTMDLPCQWYPMSDGRDHCVPTYATHSGLYADASCTRHLVRIDTCVDKSKKLRSYGINSPDRCSYEMRVMDLEPLPTGTTLFGRSGATCVPTNPPMLSAESEYVTTTEVPPSEFVASDVVHGP